MHVYLGLANYELLIVTSSTVGFVCLYTKKFDGKTDIVDPMLSSLPDADESASSCD
jgi:hypothetical protein